MRFTKMEGAGNDYIYVNCFAEGVEHDWPELARQISDRHYGVGSDGLILVMPSACADFRMRMYNRDGSEGDMCGNGIRCFARYVYDHRLTTNTQLCIETRAGIMRSRLVLDGDKVHSVEVNMGKPGLRPEDIPMRVPDGWMSAQNVPVCVGATTYSVTGVKMGNPNGVVFVHNLEDIDVARDGRLLELSPVFTEGANIEFVQVLAPELIKMKVWERGSGETLSCGTGACAALVAAANSGSTRRAAEVLLPGGRLYIEWRQDGDVMMTGPANEVCSGVFTRWTRQHDYVVTSVG